MGTAPSAILLVTGGLAALWLVILRIAAMVHPAERCPFAGMVDRPIRRKLMAGILDGVAIRSGERILELGPGPGAFIFEAARRTGRRRELGILQE